MDGDQVDEVVAALAGGGVVVLPDRHRVRPGGAGHRSASDRPRLFALKGRSDGVPLAVLCASAEQALALAGPRVEPAVAAVADRWWPGPLTLVLAAASRGRPAPRRAGHHDRRAGPRRRPRARRRRARRTDRGNERQPPRPTRRRDRRRRARPTLGDGVALVVDGGRRSVGLVDGDRHDDDALARAPGRARSAARRSSRRLAMPPGRLTPLRTTPGGIRTMPSKNEGTVDDLRQIALFARMSEAELARFAALGEPVDAESGAVLIDQGDVGVECFLVLEGEAGVFAGGQHVATIGPGTVVGEMALIGHKPRNASRDRADADATARLQHHVVQEAARRDARTRRSTSTSCSRPAPRRTATAERARAARWRRRA